MMSRRSGETGGVLSFTFLDVLTCTMGSLILLVIVLGQKAKDTRLEDALKNRGKNPPHSEDVANSQPTLGDENSAMAANLDAAEAKKRLAELRGRQAKIDKLRAEAAERLADEQARAGHLEEHQRRLEHELGKLHITLQRLEEAEKEQSVDQETADRELKRLKQLVADTEEQVNNLRKDSGGKKSYAIVPYKGANGTYRRPVYIECTKDAVTIQPEGIRLTAIDFDGPIRSGNPLAAAVRAAREELNARARAAGAVELPDPYPLLIVRPDGAKAYAAALSAINAWDADYGYEFVAADWKLEYPDADPRLSQAMIHAVDQARERQAMLARAAPRRYASRLASAGRGAGGGGGTGSGAEGDGFDVITEGGAGNRIGERTSEGYLASAGSASSSRKGSGGSMGGKSDAAADDGSTRSPTRYGEIGGRGNANEGNFADQFASHSEASSSSNSPGMGAAGLSADEGARSAVGPSGGSASKTEGELASDQSVSGPAGQSGGAGEGEGYNGAGGGSTASSTIGTPGKGSPAAAGLSGGGASGASAELGNASVVRGEFQNAAAKRGANWANADASRRASAITRPIQVVVQTDQLNVMPTDDGSGAAAKPAVVSFEQPTDRVLDELAAVLQQHIKEWGLAGQGMYWRPTLVLTVAPGAERHAIRLNDLLKDSGVDVHFKDVAERNEEASHATR
jgi:hypothetical protein